MIGKLECKKWAIKALCLIAVLGFGTQMSFVQAQCEIEANILIDSLLCGNCVTLSTFGQGQGDIIFSETFDTGAPSGWQFTQQATFTNPCSPAGVDGTTHLWMGSQSAVPRVMTTVGFDFTNATAGASVCFDLLYAEQTGDELDAPCEGPDESDEGVALQYSTDNGASWVDIEYFDPNGGSDSQLINWNEWCFQLPAAALTANTQLQWFQDFDSGADFDHWGIDNVEIYFNDPSFEIVWEHDGFSYGVGNPGGDNPIQVCPETTTTYTVNMDNGNFNCSASVTVPVWYPELVTSVSLDNDELCENECATVDAEATVLIYPEANPTYFNGEFQTIATGFGSETSIVINVQGLHNETLLDGMLQSICIEGLTFFGFNLFPPGESTIGDLNVLLQCPDGTQITLVPAGQTTSDALEGYTETCFVPAGGGDISGGSIPYTGDWTSADSFDMLTGCPSNGEWALVIEDSQTLSFGTGFFFGWDITFLDPEISYDADFSWAPTATITDASLLNAELCPAASTTYMLTVMDAFGCVSETIEVPVTVSPGCCPDPGNCDDGNCDNGEEFWNSTDCMCQQGIIPLPCADDGDCTNGLETWNLATCLCDIVPAVLGCTDPLADNFDPAANCDDDSCVNDCVDPGCDDGLCDNGEEVWNAATCLCENHKYTDTLC